MTRVYGKPFGYGESPEGTAAGFVAEYSEVFGAPADQLIAYSDIPNNGRSMQMMTDPARQYRQDPGHPEVCNVFSMHGFFSPDQVTQIEKECRSAKIGCVQCKRLFAKNLADYFAPFRERRAALAEDPDQVWDILADGARRASVIASEVIAEVKAAVGLP